MIRKIYLTLPLCLILVAGCASNEMNRKVKLNDREAVHIVRNYDPGVFSQSIGGIVSSRDRNAMWYGKKNPKGQGYFVAAKMDLDFPQKSLSIWWVSPSREVYWENGTAKDLTGDFLNYSKRQKEDLSLTSVVDLFKD